MVNESPKFSVSRQKGVATAHLSERQITDQLYIHELGEGLIGLAEQEPDANLLVDFGNVEFLSSAALGMLIVLLRRIRGKKGRLRLCSIRPAILEAFQITNLDKVFEIYPGIDEALKQ